MSGSAQSSVRIRSAEPSDLRSVETLLATSDLPLDGVGENFSTFLVADHHGEVVGAIGLEMFESAALLRSAVVSPDYRGGGVGRQLVEELLQHADRSGIDEVYLLTTTAEKYFPRFGFVRTARSAVPESVKASAEFKGACPDTATAMVRGTRAAERTTGTNANPPR